MLAGPTFNLPPETKSQGGDPLGLEAPNLRLMGSVLSGMNNTVQYLRVYALLCWACWQASRFCEKAGIAVGKAESRPIFRNLLEKIQILTNWVHVDLRDQVQLVGHTAPGFGVEDTPMTLTREAFGIGGAMYMEAGQYKPSVTNYFGFLRGSGVWACTEHGLALAQAMDVSLKQSPLHDWLANPHELIATKEQARGLLPYIDLRTPAPLEQAAFLKRFLPQTGQAEEQSLDDNRYAGMSLVLRACAAVEQAQSQDSQPVIGANEADIRATMAVGRAPDGTELNLDGVACAQAKWAVLQLRQYQRACLEALYSSVHRALNEPLTPETRTIDGLAALLGAASAQACTAGPEAKVDEVRQRFRTAMGSYSTLYDASLGNDEVNLFLRLEHLVKTKITFATDGGMVLAARAVEGLIFCAEETLNFLDLPGNGSADIRRAACLELDPDRIPLSALPDVVERFAPRAFGDFSAFCVRHYAIGQHLRVASQLLATTQDNKNRFRLMEADDGLRRVYRSEQVPGVGVGMDRLARSLDLLEQCDLLTCDNGSYRVTPLATPYVV